jgi:hypothetical protein
MRIGPTPRTAGFEMPEVTDVDVTVDAFGYATTLPSPS